MTEQFIKDFIKRTIKPLKYPKKHRGRISKNAKREYQKNLKDYVFKRKFYADICRPLIRTFPIIENMVKIVPIE